MFAKLRSGTDIAFVGGMINYAIEQNRIQQEYVREYTNASWIVGDGYNFDDGLFAGYDPEKPDATIDPSGPTRLMRRDSRGAIRLSNIPAACFNC